MCVSVCDMQIIVLTLRWVVPECFYREVAMHSSPYSPLFGSQMRKERIFLQLVTQTHTHTQMQA